MSLSQILIKHVFKAYKHRTKESEAKTRPNFRICAESCNSSSECLKNGICNLDKRCECKTGFYFDSNAKLCLVAKSEGEFCINSSECNSFSYLSCLSGIND